MIRVAIQQPVAGENSKVHQVYATIGRSGKVAGRVPLGTTTAAQPCIGHDRIASVADQEETLYISWSYEILDRAYPYSGWNIDDIGLWGNPK